MVLGLLGMCLLAMPFGLIALTQIRHRGQRGRGMAMTGLAASGCYILLASFGAAIAMLIDTDESTDEKPSNRAQSVQDVTVGDCVEDVRETDLMFSIPVVPCDQPHAAEVITQFDLTGPWPGRDESARRADAGCTDELTAALIGSPMMEVLVSFVFFPAAESHWQRSKRVSCLVMRADGDDLTQRIPR
ncbi:DUF4190 domain-containing protein [Nocardia uniformis]|uniref:DUF4190 domain-containing protein n=1 Tax=Nocardia uniformis TaxID=53432 RepID=A0A849BYE8_9NOCA|nr:DUF4190 domain-containing protein [Nocardia uniformis]NNH71304.1 DUF4190 domain-containing protein [Nocardia uniformis]